MADLGTFQTQTMTLDAARCRIEVDLEGGLTPHLKDFPATLLAFGETEVNHDIEVFVTSNPAEFRTRCLPNQV